MPGTPRPVVDPRFGPLWTPIAQGIQLLNQQAARIIASKQNQILPDQYGNAVQLSGSLDQIVTEGASFGQPGVQIWSGFSAGASGLAVVNVFVTGTITLTAGSTSATASTSSFGNGLPIGAANVTDPSTGTPTPAITPGTVVSSGGGTTSLVLSLPAAETGTGLYCVQVGWDQLA